MECKAVHKELDRGKRLLITDVDTLGGKVLEVIDYFDSLPERWGISYFHSSEEFKEALEHGDIQNNWVVVLSTDEGLAPSHIYGLTVKRNVKILILVGARRDLVDDRDLPFYI